MWHYILSVPQTQYQPVRLIRSRDPALGPVPPTNTWFFKTSNVRGVNLYDALHHQLAGLDGRSDVLLGGHYSSRLTYYLKVGLSSSNYVSTLLTCFPIVPRLWRLQETEEHAPSLEWHDGAVHAGNGSETGC